MLASGAPGCCCPLRPRLSLESRSLAAGGGLPWRAPPSWATSKFRVRISSFKNRGSEESEFEIQESFFFFFLKVSEGTSLQSFLHGSLNLQA